MSLVRGTDYAALRERMVERQLAARGIRDERVLAAMRAVPRERFVPPEAAREAYDDGPLPVAEGQTISQPYIVALMVEALQLQGGEKVLDIGTGSGYAAAVLSRIANRVYGIERHAVLVDYARERCAALGYDNIRIRQGDGTLGWPEHAPFDAIMVAAAGPEVPWPLKEQLATGGRLVLPLGPRHGIQQLVRLTKRDHAHFRRDSLGDVRFVPLIGRGVRADDGTA